MGCSRGERGLELVARAQHRAPRCGRAWSTSAVRRGCESWGCSARRGGGSGELPRGCRGLRGAAQRPEPGSRQGCPGPGAEAPGPAWSPGGALWAPGSTAVPGGCRSPGTGCPERGWGLLRGVSSSRRDVGLGERLCGALLGQGVSSGTQGCPQPQPLRV